MSEESAPPDATDDDSRRIEGYLEGREETYLEIDGWVRSELRARYPALRSELEDLSQRVHEKLLVNLRQGRFRGQSALRGYVSGIVHHTAIDQLRRKYRDSVLSSLDDVQVEGGSRNPYDTLEAAQQTRMLHRALQLSSPACRELWRLVFLEKLSYEEVGQRLSIPPGTVKSRMWHCRRKAALLLARLQRSRGGAGQLRELNRGAAEPTVGMKGSEAEG